jgi:5-methylcytosine-specific restriction endonuclease McrA
MNELDLRAIFDKMSGHCHFCGDAIKFENRGWSETPDGHWEVDHVIQRDKGGSKTSENCLPACTRCNRLRWHRTGDGIRELLLLGVIAAKEIKDGTRVGENLQRLKRERLDRNIARRKAAKT